MATESAQERKLAVILHADVVGSTALVQLNETLAHQRITQAFRRFSDTIQSYRGTVHEIRGDALVAEFPRASDAVAAALAFQQLNAAHNDTLADDIAPAMRVGISLGEVVIADDTVTGPGVVLAQRVEQLAEPGGVCATAAIYEAAPGRLPFDYLDMGTQSAKGIDDPVHVYAVALKSDSPLPLPESSASTTTPGSDVPSRHWRRIGAVGAMLVLALGGWLAWQQPWRPDVEPANPEKMAFTLPDEPSIAVLPFNGIGGDESKRQLLDGLTGTLSAALAAAPRMFVIASSSTAQYRGKDVAPGVAAEELGVRYVLKGDVQWAGEQMRVTVQLIDAIDGKSLWGERYDRKVEDIFQVQDDIVKHILAEVEGKLVWEESPALWAGMTDNLDAYLHYLKGQKALFKFTREGNESARHHAMKAIEADPEFASGWNLLGWTFFHSGRRGWGFGTKEEKWTHAENYARKAIELAPKYGSPRGMLASLQSGRLEFEASNNTCDDAIKVAPNEAILLATCSGVIRQNGKHRTALDLADRAMRLAPRHPAWFLNVKGYAHFNAGEYHAAIDALEAAIARGPRYLHLRGFLAAAYHATDDSEKALEIISEIIKEAPDVSAEKLASRNQHIPEVHQELVNALVGAGIPANPRPVPPDKPSIAVLAFSNMSSDPEQDYFAEGIAEDIITDLSKISSLFVVARNSSFSYKGKNISIKDIGNELGVGYVLEGSVRRAGDVLRVNAKLIDSATSKHVWAERYDGKTADLFSFQDEVTRAVVQATKATLGPDELAVGVRGTNNLKAYELYVRARQLVYVRETANDAYQSYELSRRAIAADPAFAEPYALVAQYIAQVARWRGVWEAMTFVKELVQDHLVDESIGELEAEMSVEKTIRVLVDKSLSIRENTVAHETLAIYYDWIRKEGEAVLAEARKLHALSPGAAGSHFWLARGYNVTGQGKKALEHFGEATRLNPLVPVPYTMELGRAYFVVGQYEAAINTFRTVAERRPHWPSPVWYLAASSALLERTGEAKEILEQLGQYWTRIEKVRQAEHLDKETMGRLVSGLRLAGISD